MNTNFGSANKQKDIIICNVSDNLTVRMAKESCEQWQLKCPSLFSQELICKPKASFCKECQNYFPRKAVLQLGYVPPSYPDYKLIAQADIQPALESSLWLGYQSNELQPTQKLMLQLSPNIFKLKVYYETIHKLNNYLHVAARTINLNGEGNNFFFRKQLFGEFGVHLDFDTNQVIRDQYLNYGRPDLAMSSSLNRIDRQIIAVKGSYMQSSQKIQNVFTLYALRHHVAFTLDQVVNNPQLQFIKFLLGISNPQSPHRWTKRMRSMCDPFDSTAGALLSYNQNTCRWVDIRIFWHLQRAHNRGIQFVFDKLQ